MKNLLIYNSYKNKTVPYAVKQDNRMREKFRICAAYHASKVLQAAIYLQDEVFTKLADLEKESRVFDADLY